MHHYMDKGYALHLRGRWGKDILQNPLLVIRAWLILAHPNIKSRHIPKTRNILLYSVLLYLRLVSCLTSLFPPPSNQTFLYRLAFQQLWHLRR